MSKLIGATLLVFTGMLTLSGALLLLAGFSLSPLPSVVAALASVGFAWLGARGTRSPLRYMVSVVGSVALLVVGSLVVSSTFFDTSWDGQAYHQIAVIELAQGWNPVYDDPLPPVVPAVFDVSIPINHYPRGGWINAAVLYLAGGHIEMGKACNLLLLVAALLLACSALRELAPTRLGGAFLLGLLFALNPVAIHQSLSFYVDGQLSSLLVCLAALLLLVGLHARHEPHTLKNGLVVLLLPFFFCLVLLVNIKFTGLVYAAVLCAGFLFWLLRSVPVRPAIRRLSAIFAAMVAAFLVGVFLVGYSPYVTNALAYGHPLHPVLGDHRIDDLISKEMPGGFHAMNRFEKLAVSLFSASANIKAPDTPALKWPFTFAATELTTFHYYPDTRVAGFGPLFSGALVLAGLVLLLALVLRLRGVATLGAVVLLVLVSVFVNSEAWWARFVPQLWMVPLLALLPLFFPRLFTPGRVSRSLAKLLRYAGYGLAATLLFNLLLVVPLYVAGQSVVSRELRGQLEALAHHPQPVEVYFEFKSARVRFEEWDIPYTSHAHPRALPCSEPAALIDGSAMVCFSDFSDGSGE